jgi:pimeloyl-ACP methyl ester carboxylesterase
MVFLHGYPLNHEMWEPQLKSLSEFAHVALPDFPGYGLSTELPAPNTLKGFSESLHQTLLDQSLAPAIVVGHSFGGYVALQMFQDHPEDFLGLVLADTRSGSDSDEARARRLGTIAQLRSPGGKFDALDIASHLLSEETWRTAGPIVEKVIRIVCNTPTPTMIATLEALAFRPDLTPVLSTIRMPALVIWGESDRLIPPSQSQAMLSKIPHGLGAAIPAAGHLPSLEQPETFNRTIQDFLNVVPTDESSTRAGPAI